MLVKGSALMALTNNQAELKEMSVIEIAYEILKEQKSTMSYLELLERVVDVKEMTPEEKEQRISYLYTNLNVDGRFVCLGDNVWGLRAWYPLEKLEEEIITAKPARKKAKAAEVEDDLIDDLEILDEDEFEDLEDELDELSEEEDRDEFAEEELDEFADDETKLEEFEDDEEEIVDEEDELS